MHRRLVVVGVAVACGRVVGVGDDGEGTSIGVGVGRWACCTAYGLSSGGLGIGCGNVGSLDVR